MCDISKLIQPATTIITALLVYELGKTAYFRQKEYELLTKRYLDEGVDAIAKNVDRSLAVFRHNWWQATVIIKHYRDMGKDVRPELYKSPGFVAPEPEMFEIWRDYRLKDIVGDQIFNRAHQSLDAFLRTSYAFFQDDLTEIVRLSVEGGKEHKITGSRDEAAKLYIAKLMELDKEAKRYYILLGELQRLAKIIQSEQFTSESIQTIQYRAEVHNGVEILKKHFPETPESESIVPKK